MGFIHQRYLWITKAVFALEWNDATDVPSQLRALGASHVVDLRTAMPQMIPPTTRLDYALRCRAEISDALAVALSLAASTGESHRLEALDQVLRANALDSLLGAATVASLGAVAAGGVLAQAAADILEAIQRQFRHFSKEAGGDWRFGHLRAE